MNNSINKGDHWIDVHTHLHMLEASWKEVQEQAQKNQVTKLITIGTQPADWPLVIESVQLSQKNFHPKENSVSVYGAIGCHPHESKDYNQKAEEQLIMNLQKEGIVSLGEIGLDYYYEHSDRKVQKDVFRRQMEIANQYQLPIEVHTRDAEVDTLSILNEYKGRVKGLLHCFTGSWDMAKKALDIGYNISFSGIITFKNANDLRETCRQVPLDRLHVETDAPYLAPTPYRGKTNQPAWLIHTAKVVAGIHHVDMQAFKKQIWKNAISLFGSKIV